MKRITSDLTRRKILSSTIAAPFVLKRANAAYFHAAAYDPNAGLPAGVTLQQIDGGPTYYADNGFTYAANAGWDSLSFFPIGLWLPPILTQAHANRWLDLGLNTAFLVTANSNLALLRSNGIWLVGSPGDFGNGTQYGSETVGLLSADENIDLSIAAVRGTANVVQDHRFWWLQNTWNVPDSGAVGPTPGKPGTQSMAVIMTTQWTTPNGTTRHFDIDSADTYWFSGSKDTGMLRPWGSIYRLGRSMTVAEGARACHYGDMVDILRGFQPTYPAPIPQFIENGGPGNSCTDAAYITPPEMNAAIWSSIIHGARWLIYFNHTFCGSHKSQDNFAQPFYRTIQPGQSISIYSQAKATHALIKTLAPIINSPFALGYVTVSPPGWTFGQISRSLTGFDVMAKWYDLKFYIFAMPRYSENTLNQTATFTIKNSGGSQATVINESRSIALTNGGTQFTDTFADGNTVHIYRID